MSSYYTTAQLEAMRKAKLLGELEESIEALKRQMAVKTENVVQEMEGRGRNLTVMIEDTGISGFSLNTKICQEPAKSHGINERRELDFSAFLEQTPQKNDRLEEALSCEIAKIYKRALLTQKDLDDRLRLLAEVQSLQKDPALDMEDKILMVRMNVTAFLNSGTLTDEVDQAALRDRLLEYGALCDLLETEGREWLPEKVESEIKRMRGILEKRRQDVYIADTLEEILEDMGCSPRENTILDHVEGQLFAVDKSPLCDVFMGVERNGILFEPVARDRGGSLEQRRQIESNAGSICSMYQELEERAAEKGILLKRVYLEPVDMETICVQADVKRTENQRQRRQQKKGREQLRTMEFE